MRFENGIVEHNITIADAYTLTGIVTGNITVLSGGNLELVGICSGDLIVESGARVNLIGIVEGRIINNGGAVIEAVLSTDSVRRSSRTSRSFFSNSKWSVTPKSDVNRRPTRKEKPASGMPISFMATRGPSVVDIANAADRMKSCTEVWVNSGSPSTTMDALETSSQNVTALMAQLQAASARGPLSEDLEMFQLHFRRWFRNWATATAFMQVTFAFAIPALVIAACTTKIVSFLGWYLAFVIVAVAAMGYLLFFPYADKVEKRLAAIRLTRVRRSQQVKALQHDLDLARATYSEIQRLYDIQMNYQRSVSEHGRLVKEFNCRRNELLNVEWRTLKGIAFESFLTRVFIDLGYQVRTTKISGDHGVDLIASKNDQCIAIQAKGWSGTVGNGAVQEVYAGKAHYKCMSCAVITNSTFTRNARDLARSTQCRLIEGNQIELLIMGKIYS